MKKATRVAVAATRISAKQKFENYKSRALAFISKLRYPNTESFFSVTGYEVVNGMKKPNHISVPEMLAIVGTAKRLGKNIQVNTSGVGDGGQIDFVFVDAPNPTVPFELL
jgi:hypothetical protein